MIRFMSAAAIIAMEAGLITAFLATRDYFYLIVPGIVLLGCIVIKKYMASRLNSQDAKGKI